MKLPAYLLNIALCFLFFLSCEQSNVENNDSEKLGNDFNDFDIAQIDSETDDSESAECIKDSDCGENEVCDPYGDCLCDAGEGLFFKYDGKCINYFEANRLFCNGHAGMIDVNPEFLKGGCAFIEKGQEKEIVCTSCLLGYVGKFCEKKIDGYKDSVMELDEENNMVDFPFPEPYCKSDSDCVEGLSCIDGYCECGGEVKFEDKNMAYLVAAHLGLKVERTVFTGKELLSIKDFQLDLSGESVDLTGLRCLSNIRKIVIPGGGSNQDFTEVTYLKKVQHLASVLYSDISWIADMENLLSLDIMIDGSLHTLDFIENFKSAQFLTSLELWIYCINGSCDNLNFTPLKKLKSMQTTAIFAMKDKIPEIDFEIFSEMKNLKEIYIRNNYGGVAKNVSKLNNINNLISLGIDMEGYDLSDLNPNSQIIFLVVNDNVVTTPVVDLFPNLMYLSYIDLGVKNTAEIISGLKRIKNLKLDYSASDLDIKYDGTEEIISEMEHLRYLYIAPFTDRDDFDFIRGNKYLHLIQLRSPSQEKPRDTSALEDLLYLSIFYDDSGGTADFSSFVQNCKNGGTLCRTDSDKYFSSGYKNEQGRNHREIHLESSEFDVSEEMDNINYLKDAGVIVEYSE